jgi:hypothetical protein
LRSGEATSRVIAPRPPDTQRSFQQERQGSRACGADSEGADDRLLCQLADHPRQGGNNPASQGVRRGMKIFRISWWVLPVVSVGTVAVIAAVLGCIVVLLRL